MKTEIEISTLDKIRSRPRFKMFTELTPQQFSENLQKYLTEHQDEFHGNINRELATIKVNSDIDAYWKPVLSLRSETEDGKTAICGVFGPTAAVWTFFMFLYFIWGILFMVFITMWFVEKQIKSSDFPWAIYAAIFVLLMLLATYAAAGFGQKKALREMSKLRSFVVDSTLPFEKITD